MRKLNLGRFRADDGATLVEFGLVAVLLIMVLLSVVEMSRMILVYTTVAQAARAGARYAVVHGGDRPTSGVSASNQASVPSCAPSSCTQINTVVQNFASAGLLNTGNLVIAVSYPNSSNAAGQPVSVSVSYPYDPIISYFKPYLSVTVGSTSEGVISF